MKKLLVLTVLLVSLSVISYGQVKEVNMPIFYGTTNKLGLDVVVTTKTNLVYGGGLTIGLNPKGKGKDYSETMGPNAFRNEIYEIRVSDNASLYGAIGYSFKNLIVGGKLGFGGATKYFNAYDKSQILSPSGYYYTATDGGSKGLLGGFVIIKVKNVNPYFGYDTFNGGILGVSIRY
jgi:hypothetical protein